MTRAAAAALVAVCFAAVQSPAQARWGRSTSTSAYDLAPADPGSPAKTCRDGIEFGILYAQDSATSPVYTTRTEVLDADDNPVAVVGEENLSLVHLTSPIVIPELSEPNTAYWMGYFTRGWHSPSGPVELEPGTKVRVRMFRDADPPFDDARTTTVTDCRLNPAPTNQVFTISVGGYPWWKPGYVHGVGEATAGGLTFSKDRLGVAGVVGTVTLPGLSGGSATVAVDLRRFAFFPLFVGNITVNDPSVAYAMGGFYLGNLTGAAPNYSGSGYLWGNGYRVLSWGVGNVV